MVFDVEILNLVLFCVQQLGVALGLGAQTVMLVAYVSAVRDNIVDEKEAQFLRATRRVLAFALVLIVVSGIAITVLHTIAGQGGTIHSPAYLFKIALIVVVMLMAMLMHVLPETFAEGFAGGNWYALFLVHILAPIASWFNLLTLWGVWLIGFLICWYVVILSTREKNVGAKVLIAPNGLKKEVKPASEPLFSFFKKKKPVEPAPQSSENKIVQDMRGQVKDLQPIVLDPKPKSPPVVTPEALKPVEVKAPFVQDAAHAIKTDAAPIVLQGSSPVISSPAGRATDTPFLPQVPPLQPIPTIPPVPGSAPANVIAPQPTMAPGVPVVPGQKAAPILQKPEELKPINEIAPEIKLGLTVMPKTPGDLNK